MTDARASALGPAALLAGATGVAIIAATMAVKRALPQREPASALAPVAMPVPPAEPIPGEAQVFRTTARAMAIEPEAKRDREAHPRTLETYRYLRAYPGAPPRIPHALSAEEVRTGACKACHERGGYSARFAAYVPLTPHADRGLCLQCHIGEYAVTGVAHPSVDPNSRCPQCHGLGGPPARQTGVSPTWRALPWPRLASRTPDASPPPIPHDASRGDCLTCHAGPAAVAELRTRHADRSDCRRCHVAAGTDEAPYARSAPLAGTARRAGP
jgi:cytochrome c-type protein NapB